MLLEWIALNAINGLGPVRIKNLLERYGTPAEVFKQSEASLCSVGGICREAAVQIKSGETMIWAKEQVSEAEAQNIIILTLDDVRFPPVLKEIFAPPPVLYVKGDPDVFRCHALAVVGTRNPTPYGERSTSAIVEQITRRGIAIVSGLARGIDTVAHKTCLENNGKTIAVLGCGVDRTYPAQNRELAVQIEKNGAVISEFPIKTQPATFNFPRRNRIISGLSAGVLVVEAGKKSGALITSSYALQQNREVFTVPGSIFSDRSEGTFGLLKSGAVPVRSAADIIEVIEVIKNRVAVDIVPAATLPSEDLLSEGERMVLSQLSEAPLRMDQIAEKTRKVVSELFDILLNLELKGFIRQTAGQQFVRS